MDLLDRGVANIIPNRNSLQTLLESGKVLNVYVGIDPTATKIHLGHAVVLRKLQKFADMGHNVTFLIGDFTALIGDTSDKDTERPILTAEQIQENFQTYKKQAEKILDFTKVTVRNNSEWLKKLTFEEIVKLCQNFSFGDFASRELIKRRLTEGKKVGLHEALYPVMQGYDSYFLDTDIQLGGTDQTFNMQAGRTLQKTLRNKESYVLATSFLTGTDGRKMSKSWGNAIWLDDSAEEIFGKVMSIKDDLIIEYFTLGTNKSLDEIKKIEERLTHENPIEIKKFLALTIASELHSEEEAQVALKKFESTVQNKELPDNISEITLTNAEAESLDVIDLLIKAGVSSSRSDAKRLIEQGGVVIDEEKVTLDIIVGDLHDKIVKAGKRNYFKILIS